MSLLSLYEDPKHADRVKRVRRFNEHLRSFYDKRPYFHFSAKAKRYSDEQYKRVLYTPKLYPVVMLGDRGLVKSNFALAELANARPCMLHVVRFSEMTEAEVRDFVRALKDGAKRYRWSREMLDIELQYLADYR